LEETTIENTDRKGTSGHSAVNTSLDENSVKQSSVYLVDDIK